LRKPCIFLIGPRELGRERAKPARPPRRPDLLVWLCWPATSETKGRTPVAAAAAKPEDIPFFHLVTVFSRAASTHASEPQREAPARQTTTTTTTAAATTQRCDELTKTH
jgi:hypothetical protein